LIVLVEGNTAKDKQVGVKASRVVGQSQAGRNYPSNKGIDISCNGKSKEVCVDWGSICNRESATRRTQRSTHWESATSKRVLHRI